MTFGPSDRSARPPRRSRARTVLLLSAAGWAALEIWLLVVVADAIGAGWVLLLLAAGFVTGGLAVRRAGRRAWNSLTAAVRAQAAAPGGPAADRAGESPARADGAGTAMLGGLLLMVPGFVSDAAGLLCLFPPTRTLLGAAGGRLGRRLGRRGYPRGSFGDAFQQARMGRPDGKVVPGEVVHDDDRPGPDRGPQDRSPKPPLTP